MTGPTDYPDNLFAGLSAPSGKVLWAEMSHVQMGRDQPLVRQAEPDGDEYVLLNGRARAFVLDAEGREACIGLYVGPTVITPNMARTRQGLSLVTLEMLDACTLLRIPASRLLDLMVANAEIREWANAIMRAELNRKVEREWCLSTLSAKQKLTWFRQHYPDQESQFPHTYIASYLGITPVTLSRARNQIP